MIDEDDQEDNNLDLETEALVYLGQAEKNKMVDVLNKNDEERRNSIRRLDVLKESIMARRESIISINKKDKELL